MQLQQERQPSLHPWPAFFLSNTRPEANGWVSDYMCQCVTLTSSALLGWILTACGLSLSSPERNITLSHSVMFAVLIFEVWGTHTRTQERQQSCTGWRLESGALKESGSCYKKWDLQECIPLFVILLVRADSCSSSCSTLHPEGEDKHEASPDNRRRHEGRGGF